MGCDEELSRFTVNATLPPFSLTLAVAVLNAAVVGTQRSSSASRTGREALRLGPPARCGLFQQAASACQESAHQVASAVAWALKRWSGSARVCQAVRNPRRREKRAGLWASMKRP